jgi:hypothetical protein
MAAAAISAVDTLVAVISVEAISAADTLRADMAVIGMAVMDGVAGAGAVVITAGARASITATMGTATVLSATTIGIVAIIRTAGTKKISDAGPERGRFRFWQSRTITVSTKRRDHSRPGAQSGGVPGLRTRDQDGMAWRP